MIKLPREHKLKGNIANIKSPFWLLCQYGEIKWQETQSYPVAILKKNGREIPENSYGLLYEYKKRRKPRYAQNRSQYNVHLARVIAFVDGTSVRIL